MVCSQFHGVIAEIPGISVDNFENPISVKARAYFLSHCHTDHTKGLYDFALISTLKQTSAPIYMSANTAAVIKNESNCPQLMNFVKVLQLGSNSITLPAVPEKNLKELHMEVVLVPAGHCFGSVMFIFKMADKNVMFTGDFRISPSDIPKYNHFHDKDGKPIIIHTMYVDTTFIDDCHTNFPKRSTSVEEALELINDWLNKGENNRVALHTSAKYGYEYVFNQLYKKLKMKVNVGRSKWQFYSNLPDLIQGVTDDEDSKIHLCSNRYDHMTHDGCIIDSENKEFLYVHFSAMIWKNFDSETGVDRKSDKKLCVCFATHCSKNEVVYFVNYFRPNKVIGFPYPYNPESPKKRSDLTCYDVSPKKKKLNSPLKDKVKDKKVDRRLLAKMFEF